MSAAETLISLAERCEAATGPNFELEQEIGRAVGWVLPTVPAPNYTSSLDAARRLVPEGLGWTLYSDGYAGVGPITDHDLPQPEITAVTPALALCAAALRARAAA